MKYLQKAFKFLSYVLIVILLLFSIAFAILQTRKGKEYLRTIVLKAAHNNGIDITIGTVQGSPPFSWNIDYAHFQINDTDSIEVQGLKLRLSIFSLLQKKFAISYLNIQHASYCFSSKELMPQSSNDFLEKLRKHAAPFLVRSLKIEELYLENIDNEESITLSIKAQAWAKRGLEDFFINVVATTPNSSNAYVELNANGNRPSKEHPDGQISTNAKIKIKTTDLFKPFVSLDFDGIFYVQTSLNGPRQAWLDLLYPKDNCSSLSSLKGRFKTQIFDLSVPEAPILDHNWEAASAFSICSDRSISIANFSLKNDWLSLTSKGDLDTTLQIKNMSGTINLFDLSHFNDVSTLPLEGSLKIDGLINQSIAEIEFNGVEIKVGTQSFEAIAGILSASKADNLWRGNIQLSANHANFPIEAETLFFLNQESLALKSLIIKGLDSQIAGDLSIGIKNLWVEGDLFAQVQQLNRFQPFLPYSRLNGSLGAQVHLATRANPDSTIQQLVKLNIVMKNLQCFHFISDNFHVTADLSDVFGKLQGNISLEGHNTYFAKLMLTSFVFNTSGEDGKWPFELDASGTWKDGLELHASGFLKERSPALSVTIDELKGFTLKKPFALEKPFTLSWTPQSLKISECRMKIGDGNFLAALDFSKESSKGYMHAEHFPIDLFGAFSPRFSLHGLSAIDAVFEANAENMEGRLNLLLEEANVLQFGKTSPLKAKGSFQANLNQKTLQIHSHLYATGEQFFQCTATLPINYDLYPFNLYFDKERPISSELLMEGKLEEIFDFVNIGSHRATGLVSAHLFLSKNLTAPSLKGNLELQNGSYENYYLGSYLKEIEAVVDAETHTLELRSASAKDKDNGSVTATGELLLHPSENFPFAIHANLENLNFLRFDSLSGNFTGPLEITGTSESALAQGELVLSQAEINIPDQLPMDIPVLPVTYINEPINLDVPFANPLPAFPFHLDLDLTSPGKIFVRGRGLSSEWHGHVHLKGTNAVITADGKLTLSKGEFVFAGKVFNLTQGEITLTDKPTQSANLSLTGTLSLSDVQVIAILRGPLSEPQLSFQSIPHMPTSSLLSRILFNKDISEISPIQALQLAPMLVTLSGGSGPNLLEAIRKSIGVDRFNIVSSSANGSDEISVQIGKYLVRGVMITLSQSPTSSNVIIEVDLRHGFIFQAETQQEQEGKFTLKWNKNY